MSDLHPFAFRIEREQREKLLQQRAHVFWLTGLSGSGKSTLADRVEQALYAAGFKTFILDGDHLRGGSVRTLDSAPLTEQRIFAVRERFVGCCGNPGW